MESRSGQPDALVIVDENGILHDAGVRPIAVQMDGTFYDFLGVDGLAGTPAVEGATDLTVAFLKSKLAK